MHVHVRIVHARLRSECQPQMSRTYLHHCRQHHHSGAPHAPVFKRYIPDYSDDNTQGGEAGGGVCSIERMRSEMAVSQADHPALHRPFYFIHPCRTAEAMAATAIHHASSPPEKFNYVWSWLSLVGRDVGLHAVPTPP